MMDRLPLVPTLVVLAAVTVMVGLGIWQLDRREQKETLITRYETALLSTQPVPFPTSAGEARALVFRRSEATCRQVRSMRMTAGRDTHGNVGWSQVALCETASGNDAEFALGLAPGPEPLAWRPGRVAGILIPGSDVPRLQARPAQAGFADYALPNPADVPNNHLAYAVQWFFFAITALVIYGLALRRRLAQAPPGG